VRDEVPRARRALIPRKMPGLRQQFADPLARNGYALIANSGATGALGLVYWLLVARLYPAPDVGRASAAFAAMNLLAGFTALNFNGAINRFIPQAGRHTRTLIIRAYAVSAAASVCVTILFLLTLRWWGASYSELGSHLAGLIFAGCVVAWAIFTLQDSVLVGLRSASWVFVENGAFGIAKIVLVVLLGASLPRFGIYISWMFPVIIAIPLVNLLIFGSLVPRHALLTGDRQPPTSRQIGRFLAGDYTGALFSLAVNLVPVLVAARISARSTAYFYMAWTISSFLVLLGINMAMALTVEGAFDASALAVKCRTALRKMAWILLPCAGLTVLLAPLALKLFGPAYAAYGAPVLQLLAIATLPSAVTELYLGSLRAQSRTSQVAVIQAVRCVLMLGLTVVLTGAIGAIGAGVAVAVSQTAVAALISVGLWRVVTGDRKQEETDRHGGLRLATMPATGRAPASEVTLEPSLSGRPPAWAPVAAVGAVAAVGLALFFASLQRVDLTRMNGLGLLSVLPVGALAGVALLTLAFMLGLTLTRARPAVLGAILAALVICLDGVTAFIEPAARFPTAYWIAGFVDYISKTGHTAPSVAAYFSWPGFFALISFLMGAAGTHSMLGLLRVWPVIINLLYLPALFFLMRNLRISWRAKWLAGFLFAVGNWVGQDYFSPQAFNYLLYLVFLAILVNWFTDPGRSRPPHVIQRFWAARLHRRIFGIVRPGELSPRPASTGQKAFLLALLVAIFTVSTASHQLTPFMMIFACAGLVLLRRCTLTGLPVLLGVILAGYISFATVGYWSGNLSNIFGGVGDLGSNLTTSIGGRLTGSTPTHLLALHARIELAAVIIGLAGLGFLRRRRRGHDDRVLLVLICVPVLMIALLSYGGEAMLRIYLFMLPAACPLGACALFPDPRAGRAAWRSWPGLAATAVLAGCAMVMPVAFFLARYGNEAFEQTPPGELAATNWIYAHDSQGVRLLWLSTPPLAGATPAMPWSYRDITKVEYLPTLAPRDPARAGQLVSALRRAGPGSYLITTQTQTAALQQTASYPPGWGERLNAAMSAAPGVRVALANSSAVIYTLDWPAGTPQRRLAQGAGGPARHLPLRASAGPIVLWLLLALLATREYSRVRRPDARLIRLLTLASAPLLLLLVGIIIERFVTLS
jgi:O-antigen/teichoic acid export membrane protein